MEGLLRDIGGTVVTTESVSLQVAYKRSLVRETYLSRHPDEIIPTSVIAQSNDRSIGDRKMKRH
ncbi:hypothetical protein Scep_007725 [Stephania cephalantha]|uniref:Uncharacterized protein n=1 Tax=Stephania cephalantha TaxID=152367 RepID=A0AAP0KC80_9MAGN